MNKATIATLVCAISAVNANEFLKEFEDKSIFKSCPKTDVVHDFDKEKYFGKWFEAYRTKTFTAEKGDCTTAEYSVRDDGKIKIVNSEQKKKNGVFQKRNTSEGYGQEKFPGEDIGSLQIAFSKF